jgi:hypothetical protein
VQRLGANRAGRHRCVGTKISLGTKFSEGANFTFKKLASEDFFCQIFSAKYFWGMQEIFSKYFFQGFHTEGRIISVRPFSHPPKPIKNLKQ